jgi:hypothetical protein
MPLVTQYGISIKPNSGSPDIASIDCLCQGGHVLRITFMAPGTALPANTTTRIGSWDPPRYRGVAFAPTDYLAWCLNLLQNEPNVSAMISVGAPQFNGLGSLMTATG